MRVMESGRIGCSAPRGLPKLDLVYRGQADTGLGNAMKHSLTIMTQLRARRCNLPALLQLRNVSECNVSKLLQLRNVPKLLQLHFCVLCVLIHS